LGLGVGEDLDNKDSANIDEIIVLRTFRSSTGAIVNAKVHYYSKINKRVIID